MWANIDAVLKNSAKYISYAYRLCRDRNTAEDIFQDALIRTRNAKDMDKVFVSAIYRAWQDDCRKKYGRDAVMYPHLESDREDELSNLAVVEQDKNVEEQDAVDRLLLGLSEDERTVVYDHLVRDMKKSEIAAQIGLTPSRINQLYKQALNVIKGKEQLYNKSA